MIGKFFLVKLFKFVPDLSAGLMFLPLFTLRSQQFLPWYLLWVLVWIPLIKSERWRRLILVFSFASSLRYLPAMSNNFEYTLAVLTSQKAVTWGIPIVYLFSTLAVFKQKGLKKQDIKVLDSLQLEEEYDE